MKKMKIITWQETIYNEKKNNYITDTNINTIIYVQLHTNVYRNKSDNRTAVVTLLLPL